MSSIRALFARRVRAVAVTLALVAGFAAVAFLVGTGPSSSDRPAFQPAPVAATPGAASFDRVGGLAGTSTWTSTEVARDEQPASADASTLASSPIDADEEIPEYRGPSPELPLDTDHPQVRVVMDVQERSTDALLAIPGVVGTAVGLDADGQLAVVVMTSRKDVAGIPSRLDDVPVVVRETGAIVAHDARATPLAGKPGGGTATVDTTIHFTGTIPIGVSTGHPTITAGTLGCRVKDSNGDTYALSNNHVYAAEGDATLGDTVLQPGAYDGGNETDDACGVLWNYAPIEFTQTASNTIDAAVALTLESRPLGRGTPSDGYGTPKAATAAAAINLGVMKYGRTTHQTTGKIGALNGTILVDYGSHGVARFVGQVVVYGGSFSKGGDSGSLIVVQKGTDAKKPVALLFAGGGGTTIANPIGAVLAAFDMTVDGD